ncbi:MAG: phosphate ABC transporter substrate-binding protein [Desulfobacterales bacterium]|mgnify:CR=1 FL=1|jgi:phosphate transport system substrate-binding protein|nr:phosphate ABC transporter substrate-binding protein [Desulfobacteraceae bacterium]MBT4363653.1 phosphate ABC transporter substrate-binding protein [Desulfobacteraceae bacterium]MBT7087177.1 phosphate ABC transporter substrate-binding protein [Desulfobacterales bacterium]MBT7697261.1 phosphate ABC transporter substrate-binding protein [Desulfobacterales bacterium]
MAGKIISAGLIILNILFFMVFTVHSDELDIFKGEKGEIRISGGTAHIPVMKEAARKIMSYNPDVRISIAGGGSGAGIKQVGEGLVDIGNSGRKPTDIEISKYGLDVVKWAIDGVGVVVNPENKVKVLTKAQLKGIFSGKIYNWKTLGGDDRNINVYTRDKASGTRSVFWKKALDKGEINSKAYFAISNGAMKTAIANDPNSIGYVSVGHIDSSVAPVSLDGVIPTLETVKSGKFKIARGLYSNTKSKPTGLTKKLIAYLISPEGQKIVMGKGFIPVK